MSKNNKNLVPFGKYEGQPLKVLLADKSYCAWLVGQASIRDQYPELCDLAFKEHGRDLKTPSHSRMQAEYMTEEVSLRLFYLVNPKIFNHDKEYYVHNINEYFADKMSIVKTVCERMNNRISKIKKMAIEISTISKNWELHRQKSFAVPVSPFKKYMDGREHEEYVFKNFAILIVNDPEEIYRNTIRDFELFYTFFEEFRSYLAESQFNQVSPCKTSFEKKFNDVTIEIKNHEEISPKFSSRVEKFFERALYRYPTCNNERINYPDFLLGEWRYVNPKKTNELYYVELKPSIGDDYHAVLNQISNRREMNETHIKQKTSQNVRYILVIGAYDGTGVSFENVKRIFKTEELDVVLEKDIDDVKLPKIERDFRISPFEIPALNEIFNILDSVKKTIRSANEFFEDSKNSAAGF
ncbi:hypothetical protein SAMN05421830_11615 [Desulfomicrobium norvegicum]|uniref:Uncharacterized protein n=1 Tax=Desulfomicrobium norvegicum (strain DSM 1741 / NCIMB 8310) TaxID=52561 RepID=A0A8G2FFU1_DESNO|nr:hypothetical protein [Desulfomicrobium norvegicum]SFM13959.1 hypothetical protein SAMN05421830_11615 [Desulfomicrobium norvegicum]